jgi:hypothetical protein
MAKSSRRGMGKIAAVAIVLVMVAMVVGVGGFFASQGPPEKQSAQQIISSELAASSTSQYSSVSSNAQSTVHLTTQSTCTGAVTEGLGIAWPSCGCVLVDSTSYGSLYVQSNPKVGDNVCIAASINGTSSVSFTITSSTGSTMFSGLCVATGGINGNPPVTGDSCLAFWNTANPDPQGNPVVAGTYDLVAVGSSATLEANFTLSP